MAREMIVHFEPPRGGNAVAADVFIASLGAIVEGLKSLSNALAPAIAEHRSWSRAEVKGALAIGFSAVWRGSLDIVVEHGFGPSGPHLDNKRIAELGWAAGAQAIKGIAQGKTVIADVPLAAAEHFVRAARVARDRNVNVELRSRIVKKSGAVSKWRTNIDLTDVEPSLSKYVERLSAAETTTTQLVGKLVLLDYDAPCFTLETGKSRVRVAMRATLREKARAHWGHEVVVLAEAKLTADGRVSEPRALDILPTAGPSSEEDEDAAFGMLKDSLGSGAASDFLESLRGRN